MGEKKNDSYLENFGMIIPTTAVYQLNGYCIFGAAAQEFENFKKWFEGQRYQQVQLNGRNLDMWIRYNDMGIDHIGYSIQELFKRWKENPSAKLPFTVTTYPLKK